MQEERFATDSAQILNNIVEGIGPQPDWHLALVGGNCGYERAYFEPITSAIYNLDLAFPALEQDRGGPAVNIDITKGGLPFANDSVDMIVALRVMNRQRIALLMREAKRVLKPGALLLSSVATGTYYQGQVYPGVGMNYVLNGVSEPKNKGLERQWEITLKKAAQHNFYVPEEWHNYGQIENFVLMQKPD